MNAEKIEQIARSLMGRMDIDEERLIGVGTLGETGVYVVRIQDFADIRLDLTQGSPPNRYFDEEQVRDLLSNEFRDIFIQYTLLKPRGLA